MSYADTLEQSFPNQQLLKAFQIARPSTDRLDRGLDDLLVEIEPHAAESHQDDSTQVVSARSEIEATPAVNVKESAVMADSPSIPLSIPAKPPIDAWNKHRDAVAKLSDEVLAERVHALSLQIAPDGVGLVSYSEIREEFCAANIEINFRKRFAPRFRFMRHSVADNSLDEENLLRDRICFDLHWLHCRNERRLIDLPDSVDPAFASLLLQPIFDFEAAWRFSGLIKKLATRAAWLSLPEELAWQLATIETDAMKHRFYTIIKGERRTGIEVQQGYYSVLAKLESNAPKRLRHSIQIWASIWMCDRMLRNTGKPTSMVAVAKLHSLAVGSEKPLDRNDISSRLQTCKKYLRA